MVILLLSLWSVIVENIVIERIQSRSRKLCETLEKMCKSDDLAMLKANEENLVKAYHAASVPHLKNIEVIIFELNLYPLIINYIMPIFLSKISVKTL